ncbi:DUF551 domain-containing protein [Citrobacter europaeus]|uniref:DUF551 domain-containing protein n=1 Tax=Citrobacter europaeus TaxID=1914243 RepID=UPI0039C1E3CB
MTTNHPAHGPVSLDRLHQIREILSKAAAQSDGGNLGYAMADAVKVIDAAITAFGADPVGYFYAEKPGDWYQISDGDRVPSHRRIPLYSRPHSSPVVKLPNEFISSEGIVVQIEKLMAVLAVHGIQYERRGNSCRAAMLQAEPVSNHDELPMDYLQGHKDGLEWAAQLAEANHPQTGDWLYDDPIELARVIRKGPDMPEFKSVSVDEDDNFYSWFGRFWYENYQKNNYTTSAKQMLGTMAEFAYRAGRESAALAGNSPVIPDTWIPVSERMPEGGEEVLCTKEFDGPGDWRKKVGYWHEGKWVVYGASWTPTHWMPLPAAPQQEVKNV